MVLKTAILGAYYLTPAVREALGYPGQQARPAVADPDLEVLVTPVRERGAVFRQTPKPSAP